MAKSTVKTRVLIISDTHCASLDTKHGLDASRTPFTIPLPKADLLIHAGDLTYHGKMHEYGTTLDMLKQIDAPVKLVIAGNHDLTLDRDHVLGHLQGNDESGRRDAQKIVAQAENFWTDPQGRARQEGVTFLTEGIHNIVLENGAHVTVYSSPYTPEFYDWGFPYERDEDRFNSPLATLTDAKNIAPYPVPSFGAAVDSIDILLTHGPPFGRLDQTERGDFAGCPHLLRAVMRVRPLLHCFGHIHEGWGSERITWSKDAGHIAEAACTISEWKNGAWKAGIADSGKQISTFPVDSATALDQHAVFVDVSNGSSRPLERGEETLLVNAAIMDVSYKPVNAPWVVDLDLPKNP